MRVPTSSFLLQDHPVFQIRAVIGKQCLFSGITSSEHCGSGLTHLRTEIKWEGWLCSLPLICEALCLMLRVHFLGHGDVGVVPATVGNGFNTVI